jgi:hypothetical protein
LFFLTPLVQRIIFVELLATGMKRLSRVRRKRLPDRFSADLEAQLTCPLLESARPLAGALAVFTLIVLFWPLD